MLTCMLCMLEFFLFRITRKEQLQGLHCSRKALLRGLSGCALCSSGCRFGISFFSHGTPRGITGSTPIAFGGGAVMSEKHLRDFRQQATAISVVVPHCVQICICHRKIRQRIKTRRWNLGCQLQSTGSVGRVLLHGAISNCYARTLQLCLIDWLLICKKENATSIHKRFACRVKKSSKEGAMHDFQRRISTNINYNYLKKI